MAGRGMGRGRGRGRGRGGGGGGMFPYAAEVPFVLFPEDVNLPDNNTNNIDVNMKRLLSWGNKFQSYWKASPYLLEETTLKERQRMHIERFSDKKKTMFTRDSLSQVLVFKDFPKELVQGTSRRTPSRKRFRWNPESDIKKLDLFEQLEKKGQGREDKGDKENKDEENENENENNENQDENEEDEEDPEEFGDDDYHQNEYFDDDEDDYNDADDGGGDDGIY